MTADLEWYSHKVQINKIFIIIDAYCGGNAFASRTKDLKFDPDQGRNIFLNLIWI